MTLPRFKIKTQANTSPVTTSELNTHLQLFGDDSYDTELAELILTAQEYVADAIGKPIANTEVVQSLNSFSRTILAHDVVSIEAVKYFDVDGSLVTLAANTDYIVDDTGETTVLEFLTSPTTYRHLAYPITIEYTAGMETVPQQVKHAILMTAGELFEVRTESTDAKARKAELCIRRLLSSNKKVVV